ncbi:MAG: replicative DNA helicase [Holosporaceae bacterium]|jgi:replicative DNA helicase|nr:replicative DNA helicase [Holosporaceae bacterium]
MILNTQTKIGMRVLPHNIEAEQSLLGAILISNEYYEAVCEIVLPIHFAAPVNGKIYEAIGSLISQGLVADPITLRAYFEKNDELKSIGGGAYLIQLVNSVVSVSGVEDYASLIRDMYLRRQLMLLGDDISHKASTFDLDMKVMDQVEHAEMRLYEMATADNRSGAEVFSKALTVTMGIVESAYKNKGKLIGVTTGFKDLDKTLGGLSRSDLVILAGRPSMGKTALATNIAFNAAMAHCHKADGGGKVMFFSLEMSKEQLVTRILSQESKIPSEKIRRGELRDDEFIKLVESGRKVAEIPLYIDDTPALNVSTLRSRARKLQRQQGLDLIVVDYLQLLHGSAEKKNENRVQEISEITRTLKAIAKELNVPVLALSQLSRAVEAREDKHPQLSDLRESGSIEQDADVVAFVYREEYYESRREPSDLEERKKWQVRMGAIVGLAEVIVAKQRHGPIGTIRMHFDGKFTKFDDLAESREESFEKKVMA